MKKDGTRFTIQFNSANPRHQIVANVLNAVKRCMASLIVDAICDYLARYGNSNEILSCSITPSVPLPQYDNDSTSDGMKKNEMRFTIRFNPADPRHKITINALNASGRRIATLIADAVYDYLVRHGSIIPSEPPSPHDTNTISEKLPIRADIEKSSVGSLDNAAYDDDIRDAVLSGLSAFSL